MSANTNIDDTLGMNLAAYRRKPRLQKADERELIRVYRAGKETSAGQAAREQLVARCQGWVVTLAKRYVGKGVPLPDLIQAGMGGLLHAIEKFDLEKNTRFPHYAQFWVRQAISRTIVNQGRTVKLPVVKDEKLQKYRKDCARLAQKLGHEPSVAELVEALELAEAEIEEFQLWEEGTVSLDAPAGEGRTQIDLLSDGTDLEASLIADENAREMAQLFQEALSDLLTEDEARVIALRFGLGDGEARGQRDTARAMRLSVQRAGELEQEALGKLREHPALRARFLG